jgi:Rho guanine nucleotide exchange factor 10
MEDSHMIREESEHESSDDEDPLEVSQEDKSTLKKKFSDSILPALAADKNNGNSVSACGPPQHGSTKLKYRNSSPIITRRPRTAAPQANASRRTSKTLPRGFSLNNGDVPGIDCDVYGLYGELLNVRDYDCDSGELIKQGDDLRKSDPELSTIPYRVSTLDRRVRMKTSRPRSLDMSSWSVESRGSSGQTTSSSEAGSERPSPNVSRNASFQSNSAATISVTPATNSGPPSITSVASSAASSSISSSSSSQQHAAPTASHTQPSQSKTPARPKLDNPKTVTTLMGGRGYINWRRAAVEKQRTTALAQINNCDAFLVIWEMKL